MAERQLPGLGLWGQWDRGADYKDKMETNLLRLSVLTQCAVIDSVATEPGTPAQGNIYRATAAWATGADGDIMAYDGAAWTAMPPQAGWIIYDVAAASFLTFDGTAWATLQTGGGSMTGAEIAAALDAELGTGWRASGGGAPITDALTVVNPDFETGDLTGWTANGTAGTIETRVGGTGAWDALLDSSWGTYVLAGGITAAAESYQDIDVSAYAAGATEYEVIAGIAQNDGTNDVVTATIELLDSGNAVLQTASKSLGAGSNTFNTDPLTVPGDPAGVTLRIRLIFTRGSAGSYINACADNVSASVTYTETDTPNLPEADANADRVVSNGDLAGEKVVAMTHATPTVTVNAGLTGAGPFTVIADGGPVTFVAGAGVTINSLDSKLTLSGPGGVATLIPRGSDVYTLAGPLV